MLLLGAQNELWNTAIGHRKHEGWKAYDDTFGNSTITQKYYNTITTLLYHHLIIFQLLISSRLSRSFASKETARCWHYLTPRKAQAGVILYHVSSPHGALILMTDCYMRYTASPVNTRYCYLVPPILLESTSSAFRGIPPSLIPYPLPVRFGGQTPSGKYKSFLSRLVEKNDARAVLQTLASTRYCNICNTSVDSFWYMPSQLYVIYRWLHTDPLFVL